jgi:hypothetical protein
MLHGAWWQVMGAYEHGHGQVDMIARVFEVGVIRDIKLYVWV